MMTSTSQLSYIIFSSQSPGFSLLERENGGSPPPTTQTFAHPTKFLSPPLPPASSQITIFKFVAANSIIDDQYSQKAVFSFGKRFELSKSLLLRFPSPGKKIPLVKKPPSPTVKFPIFSSHSLLLFGKPWIQVHNNDLFLPSCILQLIKAK